MSQPSYDRVVIADPHTGPDWRWRRSIELANGDPHVGKYADDAITRRAARYRMDNNDNDLDDVRDAAAVFVNGGLRKRALEAYLLEPVMDLTVVPAVV